MLFPIKAIGGLVFFALSLSCFAASRAPLTVSVGSQKYLGDLYLPSQPKPKMPLVLVVPEWWGKNDYTSRRARQVADELGAAAVAVDVYGDGKVVETPADATALAGAFYKDPEKGVRVLNAFLAAAPKAVAQAKASIDPAKIIAIGYCFGGTQVLNLARSGQMPAGETLAGVVTFHGGLSSTLHASHLISSKLLVLHGDADKLVKPEDVVAFKNEMKAAKADMKFVAYPGAGHAFSNPKATEIGKKYNIPVAYNESADKKSWAELKKFYEGLASK